uniref:Uncharacterized protein n=1 Tax=Davidia involucrata TaxID=16924 RepID=A0A5B7AV04_DAVIN
MQCTSFLPGCYSTRNLSVGANGSIWPAYNNDRTLKSGHSYDVFLSPPTTDQYLGYDKEILRQTMLKHEATFRDQVHELHRLYRRQRELMDEISRRELLQTSQTNPFLTQNSSEYPKSAWQVPSLPWVNPAGSRPSVLSSGNFQAPIRFSEWKSMQTGSNPAQTEDGSKDGRLLEANSRKSKKRILDLELPADECIDSEGEGFLEEKVSEVPCYAPKRMSEVLPKSDLKLFPCSGPFNSICQGGSSSPDLFSRRTNNLADLNEPAWLEDAETPNSVNLLGSDTYHREIPCRDHDLFGKSISGFQVSSKEIAHGIHIGRDAEACSKFIHLAKKDRKRELLPRNDEDGQSRSHLNTLSQISSPGKLPMPSKPLKVELLAELASVNLLDKCDRKLCSERTNFSFETSERNHGLPNEYNPGLINSCIPTSYQLVPQSDLAKSELSSFSYRRKPMHYLRQNPIAVQALPCFNIPVSEGSKSSVGRPGLNGNMFQPSRNLRCSPSVGSIGPLGNSFCLGSQSDTRTFDACPPSISVNHNANDSASEIHNHTKCFHGSDHKDVNSAKAVDLNFMPPSCVLNTAASQQKVRTADGVKKIEDLLGGLPWLRAKPDYKGKLNKKREDLTQMDSGFSQASPTSICDVEAKRFGTSNCTSNEKILVSSNLDKPHASCLNPSEDEDIENSEKVGVCDTNLAHNPAIDPGKQCSKDDLVIEIGVDNEFSGVGNHIDLNSCINEDESSPTLSVPIVIMKMVTQIDLEAPVSPENKECSPPRGESEENQLGTPLQMSKQEHGDPQEELVRMAAEAIVLISSSGFQKLFLETACVISESSHSDSLHWFAGVVSSLTGDLENEVGVVLSGDGGGDHKELLSDGSDYFEVMTLKLIETEVEEYCCKSNGQKEEEPGAILSPNQPRRGRTRRVRQRKDFQTEVLPCLASLSRHEVTEDLHTIGGLMEAVGTPLEMGLGRRNGCARGRRRRSSISPSNVVESSLLNQQSTDISELPFGERSLTGWGKTNRRQRGPRLPASNPLIFS